MPLLGGMLNKYKKLINIFINMVINAENFATVIFSGIEGFIGLFLMAYFTVSFVRKVLR